MSSVSLTAGEVQSKLERVAFLGDSEAGAISGNTPLANSILEHGGEDMIEAGLGVHWGDDWKSVLIHLEGARKVAQDAGGAIPFSFGSFAGEMSPSGAGGNGGPYYAFKLRSAGITFLINRNPGPKKDVANVRVTVGSVALMKLGFDDCWTLILLAVETLGGSLLWNKISRADLCVDLPGVDVSPFVQAFLEGRVINRARKRAYYQDGGVWTGVSVGMGGDIECRIYDKALECRNKCDDIKSELLVAKRWGGVFPSKATRVEFQIRREALRTFGVNSLEDYRGKRAAIVEYLGAEWLRVSSGDVDRTHTDLAEVAPLWIQVQEAFRSWTHLECSCAVRIHPARAESSGLVRQAFGCLASFIARISEGEILDPQSFLVKCEDLLCEYAHCVDLDLLQVRKLLARASSEPCGFMPSLAAQLSAQVTM